MMWLYVLSIGAGVATDPSSPLTLDAIPKDELAQMSPRTQAAIKAANKKLSACAKQDTKRRAEQKAHSLRTSYVLGAQGRLCWSDADATAMLPRNAATTLVELACEFTRITAKNFGANERKVLLKTFVETVWGGNLWNEWVVEIVDQFAFSAWDIVYEQDIHPRGLNDQCVDALRRIEGCAFGISGIVPSSSAVSRVRKIIDETCDLFFKFETSKLRWDGDCFSYGDLAYVIGKLFEAYKVVGVASSLINQDYIIKIGIDGAPTTKQGGFVLMTLAMCDPRTSEEIRGHPQSTKHCFPIAGFFGKESADNMISKFKARAGVCEFKESAALSLSRAYFSSRSSSVTTLGDSRQYVRSPDHRRRRERRALPLQNSPRPRQELSLEGGRRGRRRGDPNDLGMRLLSVAPRYEEPRRTRRMFATALIFAFLLFLLKSSSAVLVFRAPRETLFKNRRELRGRWHDRQLPPLYVEGIYAPPGDQARRQARARGGAVAELEL